MPTSSGTHDLLPTDTEWFLSGRSALTGVLEDAMRSKRIRTAALPSWCCESMAAPFLAKGIEVSFYPVSYVNNHLTQDLSDYVGSDLLLVMGYFGMSDAPEVPCDYGGVVVEDVTHSLLCKTWNSRADYRFGSLRKWCGCLTGGFAWNTKQRMYVAKAEVNEHYVGLRTDAMAAKASYIRGDSDDKGYLGVFAEAEEWLDHNVDAMAAHLDDVKAAMHLDVTGMRNARRSNAMLLMEQLRGSDYIGFVFSELRDDDCPLFVPVIVKERDSLRRYLIANAVYCPVHWPSFGPRSLGQAELLLYEHGLSLVCDQRYSAADMTRVIELVKEWHETN